MEGSAQWSVGTQPSGALCVPRGSCWPLGPVGRMGEQASVLILWQDLEGEDSDLSGPWFLLRAWEVLNLFGDVTPLTFRKPHIWVNSAKLLSQACTPCIRSQPVGYLV